MLSLFVYNDEFYNSYRLTSPFYNGYISIYGLNKTYNEAF